MESKERRTKLLEVICKQDSFISQKHIVKMSIAKGYGHERTIKEDMKFLEISGLVTSTKFGNRKTYNALVPNQMNPTRKQKMFEILVNRISFANEKLQKLTKLAANQRKKPETKKLAYELGLLIDTTIQVLNSFGLEPIRWKDYGELIEDLKYNFNRLGSRFFSHIGEIDQNIGKEILTSLVIR